jgi:ABC-type dipeptide/oligopeptide/nickel transport system permease component
MLSYVIKRVLLMIPTFLGVSVVIWLVMTFAPGEPASGDSQGGFGADISEGSQDRDRTNLNQRLFRQQFALDRPRLLNTWTGLDADDVKTELQVLLDRDEEARKPEPRLDIARIRKATRRLDDWGTYSIPPLLEVLKTADGPMQDLALTRLKYAAYQFKPIRAAGRKATLEERENDRRILRENRALDSPKFTWEKGAGPKRRAEVIESWDAWFAAQQEKGRWSYRDSFFERAWLLASDTQFGKYWSNLASLDFGKSFDTKEPVLGLIISKLKYSLSLALPAFLLAWIIAVFLGVISAAKHNSVLDQTTGVILFMAYSIPSFLMATVLVKWLAVEWKWFPTSRFEDAMASEMNTWDHFLDILYHLALPLFCYTYGSVAYISRQARSGMLEVMQSDFIRTARAKGVPERTVLWKHGVRNGMMPLLTMLGTALPILIAGSVVIEYIFQIPGFGQLMINSIVKRDYNVVMGISLISSLLTLIGLHITDIMYAAVDPRVSFK